VVCGGAFFIDFFNDCKRIHLAYQKRSNDINLNLRGYHAWTALANAADITRRIREVVQKGEVERGALNLNRAVHNVVTLVKHEAQRYEVEFFYKKSNQMIPIDTASAFSNDGGSCRLTNANNIYILWKYARNIKVYEMIFFTWCGIK